MNKSLKEIKEEKVRAYLLNAGLNEQQISELEKIGYFVAPASMKHHLNYEGGLTQHSLNVTDKILGLHVFNDRKSAFRVGMLHDVVKCLCYRLKKSGGYAWRDTGYPGHGVASCQILADLGITLEPRERAAITWHMGVYGMDEDGLKEYQAAVLRFPRDIILTHAADHLASVYETLQALHNEDQED